MTTDWKNKLFFGDNLKVMREHIPDESVDLIYLDPPFNSKATYNVLFAEKDGSQSSSQITAFEDTWHWDNNSELAYRHLVQEGPEKLANLIEALRKFLGMNDMMAYLTMMAIRLVEMHRILKPTGSIYLHCDPTASHYLKLVMDAVFGFDHYQNEIIWRRQNAKGLAFTRFASNHDVLLRYSKSNRYSWNMQYKPHDPKYLNQFYRHRDPITNRIYRLADLTNPNKDRPNLTYEFLGVTRVWRWTKERMQKAFQDGLIVQTRENGVPQLKRYLDEQEGTPIDDIWDDILPIQAQAIERLHYPTQKPEALLERIIKASSNEGDIVMDPFCGCGTAVAVAERLHRRWIGIDITHLAIGLMRSRLQDTFGEQLSPYEVIGDPKDLESAKALAAESRYQFEWWALGLVGARPAQDRKKGADRGIDGVIRYFDDRSGKPKTIIVQVKSGHVKRGDIATLKGDVEREKAVIGAFITLEEPTRPMIEEAAGAGFYEIYGYDPVPRIQILTIKDLLEKRARLDYHELQDTTFKKAEPKRKGEGPKQEKLFG